MRVVRFTRAHESKATTSLGERDGGDWLFWLETIKVCPWCFYTGHIADSGPCRGAGTR